MSTRQFDQKETFVTLTFNTKNRLITHHLISLGTVGSRYERQNAGLWPDPMFRNKPVYPSSTIRSLVDSSSIEKGFWMNGIPVDSTLSRAIISAV